MNITILLITALIVIFAVAGLVVGLVKGFTRVKSWAVELLLTCVISVGISKLIKTDNAIVAAAVTLGVTVLLICLFLLCSAILRKVLKKRMESCSQRYYYEHYDEINDNEEQIAAALEADDKKTYKILLKQKNKTHNGAAGVINKIFGGFTLALKGAVIAIIFLSVALAVIDFSRLATEGGALYDVFGGLYSGGVWLELKNYIFDLLVCGIILLCIKSGYSNGLSSSVWTFVVLGLVVGAGALAYNLAFNVGEFISVAEKLGEKLGGNLESFVGIMESANISRLQISQCIICAGIFVLLLIAVILIAVFVPKLIDKARDGAAFRSVDGVLGAVVLTAVIIGILLVVGAVIKSLYGLEFMNVFDAYFEKSGIAKYFYSGNPINFELPIREWLS